MYTRCPECGTTFKLGVTDLRRAQGKVRCGDCSFVFNALEYLAEELEEKTQDHLPVLDNPVTNEAGAHPATLADPYNHLDALNIPANDDSHPEETSDEELHEAEVADEDEASGADDQFSETDHEQDDGWTPVEPNDDWMTKTGIIIEKRSEPRFAPVDHEDLPTATHIRPSAENNLPTVTMEALAPTFAEQDVQQEADPEQTALSSEDAEANQPVVELPPAAEFQEEPFGAPEEFQDNFATESNSEESWSDLSNENVECETEAEAVAEPAEAEDADNEFDDSIWEKIPGVGASDEDWESVKTGANKTLSEGDKLADGLSYTDAQLKVISAHNPVEDYLGSQPDEEDTFDDTIAGDNFVDPEEQQFDDAQEESFDHAGTIADEHVNDEQDSEEMVDFPNKADEPDDEVDEKWRSFFGAEPMPEAPGDEVSAVEEDLEQTADPVIESAGDSIDQPAAEDPENKPLDPEATIVRTLPAENDAFDEIVSQVVLTDEAEAEHKLAGTFGDDAEPDFSAFEDINESQEPEQAESAESLLAEMSVAFEETDASEEASEEDIESNQANVQAEDALSEESAPEPEEKLTEQDVPQLNETDSFKQGFDPHNDTWTGIENIESVVMETGIFDPDMIEELRAQADADEADADEHPETEVDDAQSEQQPELETQQPELETQQPQAAPVWESEYANINTEESSPKSKSWLWKGLLIALVISFPMQLTHYNRDSLAANTAWGSTVRDVYSTIGLPLYPHWSLENYEIRGHEAIAGESGENVLDIRTEIAVIGNTAAGLPHLRVVLRDRWSNPLAASNFSPEEYAVNAQLPADGLLQPNQKVPAHVSIVDPGSGAQGYELELCLPRRDEGLICTDTPFK
ncbi:MAG: DUF3426 domain-containing protein [Gammaproteobacteria bacterium]